MNRAGAYPITMLHPEVMTLGLLAIIEQALKNVRNKLSSLFCHVISSKENFLTLNNLRLECCDSSL
jgi:hypothetical protein